MAKKNLVKKTRKLSRRRVNKRKTIHRGGGILNRLGFYKHTNAIRTLFKVGKGDLVMNKYNELFSQFGVQEPGTGKCITPLNIDITTVNSMPTEKEKEDFVIGKYNQAQLSTTCSTYNQEGFDATVKGFEQWLLESLNE
jgi:hypothetical protein